MKVNCEKIVTSKVASEINVEGITLLSVEEYEKLKNRIRYTNNGYWWLRSPGYDEYVVACVIGSSGNVTVYGFHVSAMLGVRPALRISNLKSSNLRIGDKIEVADCMWTVISSKLALCDDYISDQPFREDWEADNANDYEASDVKKFIEDWWNNRRA